ncbi:aromatic amino acid DMT transporter YddG [Comamonas resistens]|uniref:Aromatic amino acid DMT transporter YddG n=1 Tax=Comamonas resistens TaxID=3046670 RepID=A0ABY8STA5_9BURK|nr:aromatic amino acid DMT transporter YddG [Comamonas resistens]MDL5037429.1 aromatic amino acid DMT transporter YddG [Comamonas resistens]WHS65559.1 aromatic amino acid DMT transporter YddG [Comamonas resistens]
MNAAAAQKATAIGLIAVLCWSCTIGLMRAVAEPLGAVGGAASLYTMAALCIAVVRGRKGWRELARWRSMHPVYLWGCGALFVVYEICLSVAVGLADDRSQAMEIGVINYLWPSLTIAFAVLWGQQHARWWLWPGLLICLWGLARVLGGESFSLSTLWLHVQGNPAAYGMAFAAALLWPSYSLLARRYGAGFNAVGLFVTWTAIALWLQWLRQDAAPMQWPGSTALQLFLAGALTALGYSCWEHGIQHGKLAVLAAASYFTPVLSALTASLLLQVLPGWSFWQGVVLVTLGSLICWWATRAPTTERSEHGAG